MGSCRHKKVRPLEVSYLEGCEVEVYFYCDRCRRKVEPSSWKLTKKKSICERLLEVEENKDEE